jgi:hypothetical protein
MWSILVLADFCLADFCQGTPQHRWGTMALSSPCEPVFLEIILRLSPGRDGNGQQLTLLVLLGASIVTFVAPISNPTPVLVNVLDLQRPSLSNARLRTSINRASAWAKERWVMVA